MRKLSGKHLYGANSCEKKLSETTISKKMFGKQFVKFAKSLFETTSCKILIRNDHLQNLQQIQIVKKFATKPRLTKRFTKKKMQILHGLLGLVLTN